MRHYLFVCGCQRSGTTVAAQLLSIHPQIALGIERYKYRSLPGKFDVTPDFFTPERFLDFRPEDTNITPDADDRQARHYSAIRERIGQATVIGDKNPDYYVVLPELVEQFPECKILFLLRDPVRVASSWNVRAQLGRKNWPETNDYRMATNCWNLSIHKALEFQKAHPGRLGICEYEKLVSDLDYVHALLNWIGAGPSEEVDTYFAEQVLPEAARIGQKESDLNEEETAWVLETADTNKSAALLADCRI